MKKVGTIVVVLFILVIGFVLGYFYKASKENEDEKLVRKLSYLLDLIENVDFQFIIVEGNKMYYTFGDEQRLREHIFGRIKAKEVKEIEIPAETMAKLEGLRVPNILKIGKQIYFYLGGVLSNETGIVYSKSRDISYRHKVTKELHIYHTRGYWFYYSRY